MIKLCPKGRPLMEERENSKAFSNHMVLECQIKTQVALKTQPIFSTWHDICWVLGLRMYLISRVKSSTVPPCLKTKAPQEERACLKHKASSRLVKFARVWNSMGTKSGKMDWGTSAGQSWICSFSWLKIQRPARFLIKIHMWGMGINQR